MEAQAQNQQKNHREAKTGHQLRTKINEQTQLDINGRRVALLPFTWKHTDITDCCLIYELKSHIECFSLLFIFKIKPNYTVSCGVLPISLQRLKQPHSICKSWRSAFMKSATYLVKKIFTYIYLCRLWKSKRQRQFSDDDFIYLAGKEEPRKLIWSNVKK